MKTSNKGFIKFVVLLVVGLLLLSYFQIDLRSLWNSGIVQGNIDTVWSFIQHVWYNYIKAPIVFLLSFILGWIQ